MVNFTLSNGSLCQLTECDVYFVSQWIWKVRTNQNGRQYIYRGQNIYLHRELAERIGLSLLNDIDHKDGNTFNNTRDNLRPATRSQNIANADRRTTNKSGHKGVCWDSQTNSWRVQLTVNYERIHVGRFKNKESAIRAHHNASVEYFGEFSRREEK